MFIELLPRGRRRAKRSQTRPRRKGPISRMRKLRLGDAEPPTQGRTVSWGVKLESTRLYVLSLANPPPGQSRQWKQTGEGGGNAEGGGPWPDEGKEMPMWTCPMLAVVQHVAA